MTRNSDYAALVAGQHNNPFAILGPHSGPDGRVVRTLQPDAKAVDIVDTDGETTRCASPGSPGSSR